MHIRSAKKNCYMTWSSSYLVNYINGIQMLENTRLKATFWATVTYNEGI